MQVGLAAEDGSIFCHRRRYGRRRLAEVAIERRAVVRCAALRAMYVRKGLGKSVRRQLGAERLAGMRGIDDKSLTGKVLLSVLVGIDPGGNPRFVLWGDGCYGFDGKF